MAITWLTPTDLSVAANNAWTDVDVSASVPAGATGVILHVVNTHATVVMSGAYRKNGSSDNQTPYVQANSHFWGFVGLDANRIFEAFIQPYNSQAYIKFYLVGYFSSDAVFFTNAVNKSLSATGAWTDISIASDTGSDTALAALWDIRTAANNTKYGLRNNGSSDDLSSYITISCHMGGIIGVDSSEICEGYITSTSVTFWLMGYIKSDVTMSINATNLSLGSTGAWTDLTALPSGATGGFIEIYAPANRLYGIRKNGSTEDIYTYTGYLQFAAVECDANRIIEGKIANTDTDFFLVGYATAAASATVKNLLQGHVLNPCELGFWPG